MINKDLLIQELNELIKRHNITTSIALFSDGSSPNDVVLMQGNAATIMVANLTLSKNLYESLERRINGVSIDAITPSSTLQ